MLITGVKPPLDKTGPAPTEVKGANQSVLYTLNQGITVVPKVSLLLNLLVKIEPVLTVPKSIAIAVFIYCPTDLTQVLQRQYIPLFCDAVWSLTNTLSFATRTIPSIVRSPESVVIFAVEATRQVAL
jgi:hypothetical protein